MDPKNQVLLSFMRQLSGFIDPKRALEVVELVGKSAVGEDLKTAVLLQLPPGSLAARDFAQLSPLQKAFLQDFWSVSGGVTHLTAVEMEPKLNLPVELIQAHRRALLNQGYLERVKVRNRQGWGLTGRGRALLVYMEKMRREAEEAKGGKADLFNPGSARGTLYAHAPLPRAAAARA